ncbi:hypothetical protein PHYC_02206 [Phycisphaerales bacterium]|nr:hypothetical protein PHYC_02206 [Phycisphaerales bacterium]
MRGVRVGVVMMVAALVVACDQQSGSGSNAAPPGGNQSPFASDRQVVGTGGRSTLAAPDGVEIVNRLPICLIRGETGDLEVASEGPRNRIVRGQVRLPVAKLADRGIDRVRRVEDIQVSPDVVIVFVDVSRKPGLKTCSAAIDGPFTEAPSLVDTQNERYLPVGYAYLDASWAEVRYEPGDVVTKISQLPSTTRSRTDQRLWLIYRVSFGRSVRYLASGNKAVYEFNPPFALHVAQGP